MDLSFSAADEAFRREVREFMATGLPDGIRRKVANGERLTKQDHVTWQQALWRRGWIAPNWPVAYGGTGWSPTQRYIFEQEMALGCGPYVIAFGLKMVGPVIYTFGTDAQKTRYLPGILSSETWWCQGYSEPGAGSDLANLRTRAVRDGDHYGVDGAKTWTTDAQHADRMFCLVRTDAKAKKQEGISFLLIDMRSPGITVKPIITIDGAHEVNEVHFDQVRVPVENRIGEENLGWTYAKFLLGNERTNIAGVGRTKMQLERIKRIAAAEPAGEGALIDQPRFRAKIAQLEIDLMALEMTELRILSAESAGRGVGPEASMMKIRGTELQQRATELLMEAVGPYALPARLPMPDGANEPPVGPDYAATLAPYYLNWRKSSIYGGSNEIQRNIISKAVLGL